MLDACQLSGGSSLGRGAGQQEAFLPTPPAREPGLPVRAAAKVARDSPGVARS